MRRSREGCDAPILFGKGALPIDCPICAVRAAWARLGPRPSISAREGLSPAMDCGRGARRAFAIHIEYAGTAIPLTKTVSFRIAEFGDPAPKESGRKLRLLRS